MHVKSIQIHAYRRFSDLRIESIPATARLVVMAGPNGGGKSSLLDAFLTWHAVNGSGRNAYEETYHHKTGLAPDLSWTMKVQIEFHETLPADPQERRKLIYVRSGYRNEADFTVNNLQRMGSIFDGPHVNRTIDTDISVSQNYQRLVSKTVEGLFGGRHDTQTGKEIREHFIGQIRESMSRVFADEGLLLEGPGDPMGVGTFFFEKGVSKNFHYKNLSAGEKAAFDLILDLLVKAATYDNTVFCIDEPELHMHARLQARLLEELYRLIPNNSQLWIATHSAGMLRKAQDLWRANPDGVVFLDFQDQDFDQPVVMEPAKVTRELWMRHLGTAVDDLASLVAPGHVVLCEGEPGRGDFDARCYRAIFAAEFPDVEFVSVGNDREVVGDRRWLGRTLTTLVQGTKITGVVDRDDRNPQEIAELGRRGVRVLSRRHLEAYLLDDDVLRALCIQAGHPEKEAEVLEAMRKAVQSAQSRGAPKDDVKSAAGEFYVAVKAILSLTQVGNSSEAFLRDTVAPLIPKVQSVYKQLREDVLGAA